MSTTPEMRPPPPLAKRLALLIGLVVIAGLGIALVIRIGAAMQEQASLEAERQASADAAGQAARVEVVQPTPTETAPLVVLTGTLEPAQAADLAFEVPGRVASVSVRLGQAVRAGEVLVTLDRASVGSSPSRRRSSRKPRRAGGRSPRRAPITRCARPSTESSRASRAASA